MGGSAFWNFCRQGGVKTWKPSMVGYGYFLELPINISGSKRRNEEFLKTLIVIDTVVGEKQCYRIIPDSLQEM